MGLQVIMACGRDVRIPLIPDGVSVTHAASRPYGREAAAYVQASRLKAVAVVYKRLLNSRSPEETLVTLFLGQNMGRGRNVSKYSNFILSSLLTVSVGLAGCATAPESDPAYVSPLQYQDYNCKQIKAEMRRVSGKIEQAAKTDQTGQVLDAALTVFAISQGYGVYSEDNPEYRRLQNQYDVLEQTAIQKECN